MCFDRWVSTRTVTEVVGLSSVIRQKFHRVILVNVLRVLFDEILCGLPEGGDSPRELK